MPTLAILDGVGDGGVGSTGVTDVVCGGGFKDDEADMDGLQTLASNM
jgi:hypothetical protein